MAMYTVHAGTEAEVRVKLARLCALLGAVPKGRPMLLPARDAGECWMARAVERPAGVRAVREYGGCGHTGVAADTDPRSAP